MRKHDVRKWLHAVLDLLPVILIPVFMIYSHRHEINDGSIQVQEKEVVDFNQLIDVENTNYWDKLNSYSISISNDLTASYFRVTDVMSFESSHQYYFNIKSSSLCFRTVSQDLIPFLNSQNLFDGYSAILSGSSQGQVIIINDSGFTEGVSTLDFNIVDLTQMYGVGNEPTVSEFKTNYPNFYDYVLSHKELIDGDLVTYNDTDIMSQFTYQLYNSVDKYFNMGNVFHLNEVYDWFNLNVFNGQAPIYIFIVYQIVLYELIMDLLMLLYSLFMWFIDMVQKLMEKPLNSVK